MRITLGDKIEIIIANARAWNKEVHNDKFYTDEIIKLFEKLIDEKIQRGSNIDKFVKTSTLGITYEKGFKTSLEELKKELKEK